MRKTEYQTAGRKRDETMKKEIWIQITEEQTVNEVENFICELDDKYLGCIPVIVYHHEERTVSYLRDTYNLDELAINRLKKVYGNHNVVLKTLDDNPYKETTGRVNRISDEIEEIMKDGWSELQAIEILKLQCLRSIEFDVKEMSVEIGAML